MRVRRTRRQSREATLAAPRRLALLRGTSWCDRFFDAAQQRREKGAFSEAKAGFVAFGAFAGAQRRNGWAEPENDGAFEAQSNSHGRPRAIKILLPRSLAAWRPFSRPPRLAFLALKVNLAPGPCSVLNCCLIILIPGPKDLVSKLALAWIPGPEDLVQASP